MKLSKIEEEILKQIFDKCENQPEKNSAIFTDGSYACLIEHSELSLSDLFHITNKLEKFGLIQTANTLNNAAAKITYEGKQYFENKPVMKKWEIALKDLIDNNEINTFIENKLPDDIFIYLKENNYIGSFRKADNKIHFKLTYEGQHFFDEKPNEVNSIIHIGDNIQGDCYKTVDNTKNFTSNDNSVNISEKSKVKCSNLTTGNNVDNKKTSLKTKNTNIGEGKNSVITETKINTDVSATFNKQEKKESWFKKLFMRK